MRPWLAFSNLLVISAGQFMISSAWYSHVFCLARVSIVTRQVNVTLARDAILGSINALYICCMLAIASALNDGDHINKPSPN